LKTENKKHYKYILFILALFFSTYTFILAIESNSENDNLYNILFNPDNSSELDFIKSNPIQEEKHFFFPPDSTKLQSVLDSLKADSLLVDSTKIDSTARLKDFKYVRKDSKYLSLFPKRKSLPNILSCLKKPKNATIVF